MEEVMVIVGTKCGNCSITLSKGVTGMVILTPNKEQVAINCAIELIFKIPKSDVPNGLRFCSKCMRILRNMYILHKNFYDLMSLESELSNLFERTKNMLERQRLFIQNLHPVNLALDSQDMGDVVQDIKTKKISTLNNVKLEKSKGVKKMYRGKLKVRKDIFEDESEFDENSSEEGPMEAIDSNQIELIVEFRTDSEIEIPKIVPVPRPTGCSKRKQIFKTLDETPLDGNRVNSVSDLVFAPAPSTKEASLVFDDALMAYSKQLTFETVMCPICLQFNLPKNPTRFDIMSHASKHHQLKTIFKCSFCLISLPFETKDDTRSLYQQIKYDSLSVRKHFASHHWSDDTEIISKRHTSRVKKLDTGCLRLVEFVPIEPLRKRVRVRPCHCTGCDLMFKGVLAKEEFQNHNDLFHNGKPVGETCEVCGKYFRNYYSLRGHMLRHREQTGSIECRVCGKPIKTLQERTRHEFTHLNEQERNSIRRHNTESPTDYLCSFCGAMRKSQGLLNSHIKTVHSDKITDKDEKVSKKFYCDICEFTGALSTAKRHKQRHAMDPPQKYPCDTCSEVLLSRSKLKNHKLYCCDEKVRPHKCDLCLKRFRLKQHLMVHLIDCHHRTPIEARSELYPGLRIPEWIKDLKQRQQRQAKKRLKSKSIRRAKTITK